MTHGGTWLTESTIAPFLCCLESLKVDCIEDMVLCNFTVAQGDFGGLNKQICNEPRDHKIVCNQPKREEVEEVQSPYQGSRLANPKGPVTRNPSTILVRPLQNMIHDR